LHDLLHFLCCGHCLTNPCVWGPTKNSAPLQCRQVPLPQGPPFFQFASLATCVESLEAAGFVGVERRVVPQTLRLAKAGNLLEMFLRGTARTRALLLGQTLADREAIRARVEADVAERFAAGGGGFELPMPAVVVSASVPG
jgi:hypothetical protein